MFQIKSYFLAVIFVGFLFTTFGQKNSILNIQPLVLDPAVKTGKLKNGLTYFILKNRKPENRVEMRLAVNAGSCQEDDDQLGLAHFCEHMAFNGSRNFKKNELVDFLESVGTKFGPHLNAYTSFDETVYMLQVHTDKPDIVDKALLILRDWAGDLSLEGEEIEKERGVVIEEWRLGQGADERMRQKYWPVLFGGSRYGDRLPIGKKDILETFKHEVLRRFYRDWYRPEFMSVIIVGDINPDEIETKIKKMFSVLIGAKNGKKKENYTIAQAREARVAVARDPEATFNVIQVLYILPKERIINENDLKKKILSDFVNGMLNERFSDIQKNPECPFIFGSTVKANFFRNNGLLFCFAIPKPGKEIQSLEVLITEFRRSQIHGFTLSEFERQKNDLLKSIEKDFNEKNNRESDKLANGLVAYYLQGMPFLSPDYEYQLKKIIIESITINDIQTHLLEYFQELQFPRIISTGPEVEGESPLSEKVLLEAFQNVLQSPVEPKTEVQISDKLLPNSPEPGKILISKIIPATDIKEFYLSNGAKVYFKKTDFKNDEVMMRAISFGGLSKVKLEDLVSARNAIEMHGFSGLGDFDATTLEKMLKGKNVSLSINMSETTEEINGASTVSDVETLFQLLYLTFTKPRIDDKGFNLTRQSKEIFLSQKSKDPENNFEDSVSFIVNNRHPRMKPEALVDLKYLEKEKSFSFLQERLMNAGDFDFLVVGNLEEDKIRVLIENYIASLPGKRERESFTDHGIRLISGKHALEIKKGLDPKSMVKIIFNGPEEFNFITQWQAEAASALLAIRLREVLREEKGGVYYVHCISSVQARPVGRFRSVIQFGCDPTRVEELIHAVRQVIEEVKSKGADPLNLQKIKETFKRELETNQKTNQWWMSKISDFVLNKKEFFSEEKYLNWLDSVQPEDFKKWVQKYFNGTNESVFVLKPEK